MSKPKSKDGEMRRALFIIPFEEGRKDYVYERLEKSYGDRIISKECSRGLYPVILLRMEYEDLVDVRHHIVDIAHFNPTIYSISKE